MTDNMSNDGKRGRGRPTGITAGRWSVRAAILDARASARLQGKARPTNALIIANLNSQPGFTPGDTESAERIIRDERAALERHEARHPSNPFAGLFDLPMPTAKDIEARDTWTAKRRKDKRVEAAEKQNRKPAEK